MALSKATKNTAFWTTINTFFGLAQYFVLLNANWLKITTFGPKETIAEGVVLFFCSALMGSTLADLVIAEIPMPEKGKFVLYISPLLILGVVIYVYVIANFVHTRPIPLYQLINTQRIIIVFAFMYCVSVKYLIFKEENKNA